jgi:outer membrane protein
MMNNKLLISINALLLLAVGVLFALHFTRNNTEIEDLSEHEVVPDRPTDSLEKPLVDTSTLELPMFAGGLKIAFVNSDSLNKNYKYFEDAKTEIGLELAKAQGRIKGKQNSLIKKYSELEKQAQSGQMWNDEIQVEAAKLQEEEMKLGQEAQELQAKLANVEYEVTLKVINETADYLNDIGKQLGYDYVLTYSKSNQIILFANDELDITDYVTVKLNKAYAAKTE